MEYRESESARCSLLFLWPRLFFWSCTLKTLSDDQLCAQLPHCVSAPYPRPNSCGEKDLAQLGTILFHQIRLLFVTMRLYSHDSILWFCKLNCSGSVSAARSTWDVEQRGLYSLFHLHCRWDATSANLILATWVAWQTFDVELQHMNRPHVGQRSVSYSIKTGSI